MSYIENGIPCYRITQEQLEELISLNSNSPSAFLQGLIDAFSLSYALYPNTTYDGYIYAPASLIDTFEEEDWVLENTDGMIYYFRTSVQPGGGG